MTKTRPEVYEIDILQMELDKKLPHWLDWPQRYPDKAEAIRKKHRDKYLAEQKQKKRTKAFQAARMQAQATLDRLRAFDPSQPRDEDGKWTSGGGGSSGKKHPGEGYSKDAYVEDGVIHTTSVEDAARALHEGKKVELDQPRKISVLIDKLGQIAKDMIAKGQDAPVFDLCNVSIKGTNLFCGDSHGIPRIEMPQIPDDKIAAFQQHLKDQGFAVEVTETPASHLRATQNELNGAKVAAVAGELRAGKLSLKARRIVVSKDDYILDGHHHWAAKVGLDFEDGVLNNDTKIKIARVNISITKLLEEAEKFTGGAGKQSVAGKSANQIVAAYARAFDPSQPRDEHGKWTDTGADDDGGGEKPAVAGFSPGVKANTDDAVKQTKEDWFSASPFKGDIEGAIAAAPAAQKELGTVGSDIAAKHGVEFKNPGVKTDLKRIRQKVELRGGAERVTDLARAAFVISEPQQADAIAADLGKHFEVAAEPWNVTPVLYADKALQVRFKNGLIGEVQIMDRAMAMAKSPDGGRGHDLYVEQRKLDPVKDKARYDALTVQQQTLYGNVLQGYSPSWRAALRRP